MLEVLALSKRGDVHMYCSMVLSIAETSTLIADFSRLLSNKLLYYCWSRFVLFLVDFLISPMKLAQIKDKH